MGRNLSTLAQQEQQPKKKTTRKAGKPPWIPTAATLTDVEKYASLGLKLEQIASCIGIHVATLCKKKNQYDELNEAIKKGKAKAIAAAARTVVEAATIDKNLTAAIFFLKCHGGWREKEAEKEHKHSGEIRIVRTIVTGKSRE